MADLKNVTTQNVACALVKIKIRKLRKWVNTYTCDEEKAQALSTALAYDYRLASWVKLANFNAHDLLRLL